MTPQPSKIMPQKIFTEQFETTLQGDIEGNLKSYASDHVWVPEVYSSRNYEIQSQIELRDGLTFRLPEENNLFDIENSKIIFDAFRPQLSRTQASDPRFWTYLTHITFWEYMRARWQVGSKFKNDAPDERRKKQKTYVTEHYFVQSNQSRALLRNGLARLWWFAFHTYDGSRQNPFELTAVLLTKLDIARETLERNLGRNRDVLHGILEFLLDKDELINGGDAGRARIRLLIRSLNLHGGFCVLDNLSRKDIRTFLAKRYSQIKNGAQAEFDDLMNEDASDEDEEV